MSVIVTANYRGETFEVEIFRDGGIDFPDRDFQYEKAVAEFAPPGPTTVQFYEFWKMFPAEVICENLDLPENSLTRLAADCAEHVLKIFEDRNANDTRPRSAITATRDLLVGKISQKDIGRFLSEAEVAANGAIGWEGTLVAEAAMATILSMSSSVEARRAMVRAISAAARDGNPDRFSTGWKRSHDAERDWQVRRFVDCMEAIGQGKEWPDLGVTK